VFLFLSCGSVEAVEGRAWYRQGIERIADRGGDRWGAGGLEGSRFCCSFLSPLKLSNFVGKLLSVDVVSHRRFLCQTT
jgi:hypothetical protein